MAKLKSILSKKLPKKAYPQYLVKISDEELSMIAHAKRFKERYTGDPAFRKLVAIDSRKAAKDYNINVDPEEIRPLWDSVAGQAYTQQNLPVSHLLKLCLVHEREMVNWSTRHKDGATISNLNYKMWRQRQIARANGEISVPFNSKIVHAPVCFELSSGCTVGCWFCAISAEKFKGAFAYTQENRDLWKDVLKVVYDITGTAAQAGFCYWATDPFDNPDYEKFIKDFHTVIGAYPSTNTAKAHKDLPRVRSLINMWKKFGFVDNHLSILTVNILDKVHSEFTAEELVWTPLNLVNKDSEVKKATAGRAREKTIKLSKISDEYKEVQQELTQGTIACVSGFLFNMVEKTVKLISPCKSSEQWPNGYLIFDEGTFTSGADLKILLDGMLEKNMPVSVPSNQVVKFRTDLVFKPLSKGFELVSEFQTQKIENATYGKEFGELILKGCYTADDIVEAVSKLGATHEEILSSIDVLFKNGLLAEV